MTVTVIYTFSTTLNIALWRPYLDVNVHYTAYILVILVLFFHMHLSDVLTFIMFIILPTE